ncbi:MAG: Crp/Fnr family transcriptional regulator [Aureispira sp.]|nr:Crp/Fnr family transcriptional regulator [Aureispira sp.]
MIPKLFKLINKIVPLGKEEQEWVQDALQLQVVKKGEFFIKEGQVCNTLGFLQTGIMRVFTNVEGKEHTNYFCFERRNPVVCAHMSFISRKPSLESIQALEDTEMLSISYYALQKLYQQSPKFQELGRLMMEQTYIDAKLRILALQTQPAQARYQRMLDKYPNMINQISHHYIASYLGIAPESLSRIRRQLMKS